MRIVLLAAGAGGMYCGSCLRDNALAAAMMRAAGDDEILLVPLYTPMRTDEPTASTDAVYYGGVNVYLQQASGIFRHTPRAIDWILDRPALLKAIGKRAGAQAPAELGALTVSILAGDSGRQRKELHRLLDALSETMRPDVVILPNLMFAGIVEPIARRTGAAVICELTGEDAFLAALAEPHRCEAQALIREGAEHVDRFIATSAYYADLMAAYMDVSRERIDVVLPGITADGLDPAGERPTGRPPTVCHLARMCPEKGLDALVNAMGLLRRRPDLANARLRVGGFLPPGGPDRAWFDALRRRADAELPGGAFEYVGEVDRAGKAALLRSADVLCVPTAHGAAKGLFVLEGWACGLPFVGFDHGALPELLDAAAAEGVCPGALAPLNDVEALADTLADLLTDPRRAELGRIARMAVETTFTADRMAAEVLGIAQALRPDS